MEPVVISKKLLKRLPLYLAHLKALPENSNVSATSMARYLGLGEVMVRKDLAKISETGRRRTGRSREPHCTPCTKPFAQGAHIISTPTMH